MRKNLAFALFFFLLSLNAFSEKVSLTGYLFNSDSTQRLAGVQIFSNPGNDYAISNSKGYYSLQISKGKKAEILFLHAGYSPMQIELNILKDTQINIYLNQRINELDPVLLMTKQTASNNITGSSTYISPKELEVFNHTDASLALRNVPGIQIQQEDGFGLRPNIGLRATGVERSAKITIMEDGILAAPAPYIAPAAYYFPSIGRMEGIEIVKGSSQIQYGPFTTGGAINFISAIIPENLSGNVNMNYGSFNTFNILAKTGMQGERFGFVIQSFNQESDGFKVLSNGGPTGFNKSDYLLKFRYQTLATAKIQQQLTVKLSQTSEESNETYLGLSNSDYNESPYQRYSASQLDLMTSRQQHASLHHQLSWSKRTSLSTTIYNQTFTRNWYKLNHFTDSAGDKIGLSQVIQNESRGLDILRGANTLDGELVWLRANNRNYYSRGIQSEFNHKFGLRNHRFHHLQIGARLHQDQIDRFQWEDGYNMENNALQLVAKGAPGSESNRVETATAFSGYVNYRIVSRKLEIKPGLRLENIDMLREDYGKSDPNRQGTDLKTRTNNNFIVLPGVGVHYSLADNKEVFAGVHRGFAPSGSQTGASAETSINYELGFNLNELLTNAQIVGFVSSYDNLLGSDLNAVGGSGTGDLFNGGNSLAYGIEFLATTSKLLSKSNKFNLPITVGYTFTQAQFNSSFNSSFDPWGDVLEGDFLPYLAAHQANVQLRLEHARFNININTKYTDAMRLQAGQEALSSVEVIPASLFLDLSVNYNLNPRIQAQLSIINLGDNNVVISSRPHGLRPALPRMLRLGLNARI